MTSPESASAVDRSVARPTRAKKKFSFFQFGVGTIGVACLVASRLLGFGCAREDGLTYSEAADPRAGIGRTGFEWALFDGTANDYNNQRISRYFIGNDSCYYEIEIPDVKSELEE